MCGYEYSFAPVYKEGTPQVLPVFDFLMGMGALAMQRLKFVLRLAYIGFLWMFTIPIILGKIIRFSLIFDAGISLYEVAIDGLIGMGLMLFAFCVYCGIVFFIDYIKRLREEEDIMNFIQNDLNGEQEEPEDENSEEEEDEEEEDNVEDEFFGLRDNIVDMIQLGDENDDRVELDEFFGLTGNVIEASMNAFFLTLGIILLLVILLIFPAYVGNAVSFRICINFF